MRARSNARFDATVRRSSDPRPRIAEPARSPQSRRRGRFSLPQGAIRGSRSDWSVLRVGSRERRAAARRPDQELQPCGRNGESGKLEARPSPGRGRGRPGKIGEIRDRSREADRAFPAAGVGMAALASLGRCRGGSLRPPVFRVLAACVAPVRVGVRVPVRMRVRANAVREPRRRLDPVQKRVRQPERPRRKGERDRARRTGDASAAGRRFHGTATGRVVDGERLSKISSRVGSSCRRRGEVPHVKRIGDGTADH